MAPASLPPCSLFCRCCCWSFRRHRWCSLHRRRHRCSFFAGEKEDNLLMKIKKRTNRKNLATAATSTTLSSPISPPPLSLSRYSFCKSTLFPVNQSGPLCKYTLFPVNHSIDGSIPAIKLATYRRRLGSDNKVNRDKVNACKVPLARNMGSEFSCMIKEAKILGKDGCFTADSDIFLFGAKTVYRDIDLADGGHVVSYELADVEEKLGFRRNSLF